MKNVKKISFKQIKMSVVKLTKIASRELAKLANNKNVLLKITNNDCGEFIGFKYNLVQTPDHPKLFDEIVKINNTSNLIVTEKSLLYVLGTVIDYDTKFVFKNPNATTSCKCGNSFTV